MLPNQQSRIKSLEDNLSWIQNGLMPRTQKQCFYRMIDQEHVLDAYALIDKYKILNTDH
jgi:hypothetical protein